MRAVVTPEKVERSLRAKGYECIGGGCYGQAFAKPGADHVIKVPRRECRDGVKNDGWFAFATFARSHQSPHFPRIDRLSVVNKGTEAEFYVARMERLEPLPSYDDPEPTSIKLRYMAYDAEEAFGFKGDFKEAFDRLPETMRPTLSELRHWYENEGNQFGVDLHTGNVMLRPDRGGEPTLVITDPVA